MTFDFNMRFRALAAGAGVAVMAAFAAPGAQQEARAQAPSATSPAPAVAAAPAPSSVTPAPLQLTDDAPTRYTVKKGDTLWSIATRFLKNPGQWHEIWRMNRDQIKSPHRIYPGEVLVLNRAADGRPQLMVEKAPVPAGEAERPVVRLSPQMHITPIDNDAIPAIPPAVIEPFLTKPLVIERDALEGSPKIVGTSETRVVLAPGYKIYGVGVTEGQSPRWQIYRQGKALTTLGRKDVLGYEAVYLGDAVVDKYGEVSTLTIVNATQEIVVGDKLIQVPRERIISYPPHSPDREVTGRVISLPTSMVETGRDAVVALDVGSRDGIEIGHVLALYHQPGTIVVTDEQKKNPYTMQPEKRTLTLPDERVGLAFVFRVFEHVSYALVLNSTKQVELGDSVRKP